ncbi:hypothetical protein PINS_up014421 [Pythium insidiosum]|nr:hypothetical protein PINS_up014421 [Pythium insidiosum]
MDPNGPPGLGLVQAHELNPAALGIPLIALEHLEFSRRIGPGRNGTHVYRGTMTSSTTEVAIKRLEGATPAQTARWLSRLQVLVALPPHERLVRVLGVAVSSSSSSTSASSTSLCVVSEFIAGGDLRSMLDRFYFQSRAVGFDRDKIQIAMHVAEALAFLHAQSPAVLHRHLTSRNVLLLLLPNSTSAKLSDAGLVLQEAAEDEEEEGHAASASASLWTAPEVLRGERVDASADVFSFGVLLSELDTHQLPYAQDGHVASTAALRLKVASGRATVRFTPPTMAPEAVDLVELGRQCVVARATDRPTMREALSRVRAVWRSVIQPPPYEAAHEEEEALSCTRVS